jgi:hypothetical protein
MGTSVKSKKDFTILNREEEGTDGNGVTDPICLPCFASEKEPRVLERYD